MKKFILLFLVAVFTGCSNNEAVIPKRGYHPVKIHLAGGEFPKLHAAALGILGKHGAAHIDSSGDSVIWGKVTISDPSAATYDCEIRMRGQKDGVWFEITSENWSTENGTKVNHRFAEEIADKMGFILPTK